jgi:uncharacterized membrane protein
MKSFISAISGQEFPISERVRAGAIRSAILQLIQSDHPEFNAKDSISLSELNRYRMQFISQYLIKEVGELSELEHTVLDAIEHEGTVTENIESSDTPPSYGQHLADQVALFGGSWRFIISFGVFILIWILINVFWIGHQGFDPYPFILLNLILSCIASLQAPVIMMSQNRQEEKDRERAKQDYIINLKSELEIRMLHEKIDHLIMHQQQELLEIQKVQVDMMTDILSKVK